MAISLNAGVRSLSRNPWQGKSTEGGFAQKVVLCRAYGAVLRCDHYPGLTPWATLWRSLRELIQPRSGVST
jgi:hypothetical protein